MGSAGNNWGVDNNKKVHTESRSKTKDNSNQKTWGQINNSYSSGYSATLKTINIIRAFIIPFIIYTISGFIFMDKTDGVSVVMALIGYVVTSFTLWVNLSYKAKLFENISKLAQNSEAILYEIQNKKEEHYNDGNT